MKVSPYYIDVGKNNSNLVGGGGHTHKENHQDGVCKNILC